MEKLLLSHDEAREALGGLGRTKLYALMDSGELETVKLGRRRMVLASSLREFVERLRS